MIATALRLRLRKLALEHLIVPGRFDRALSLALDRVIVAIAEAAR